MTVQPEVWKRLGAEVILVLKSAADLTVDVELEVSLNTDLGVGKAAGLHEIVHDWVFEGQLKIDQTRSSSS
jgi:hypothetical protein